MKVCKRSRLDNLMRGLDLAADCPLKMALKRQASSPVLRKAAEPEEPRTGPGREPPPGFNLSSESHREEPLMNSGTSLSRESPTHQEANRRGTVPPHLGKGGALGDPSSAPPRRAAG